jgi:ribonucleoside-diphosphate reductase alpha chain
MVTKGNAKDNVKLLVPSMHLKNKYDYGSEMTSMDGYLKVVAVMAKWVDQALSANTTYNPAVYPDGKISISTLLKDILTAYKLGSKTLYYQNTIVGTEDSIEAVESECESCKI